MKHYRLKPIKRHKIDRFIREMMAETIRERSQITDVNPSDRMVEIEQDTDTVMPMTDRIMERYTEYHLRYFSETSDDEGAYDG